MAIKISLFADFNGKGIQQAIAKFKELETTSDKAQFAIKKAAVPAAAALGGLAVAGVKFANAAAEDQKAQALLARQLRSSANATDAQVKATEAYITKAMMSAAVSDDALRPALSKLVTATKDVTKAQDLLNTALDVSAATGADLQNVSDALAKAYAGNMRGLRSLSPEMAKLIKSGASFAEVMAVLTQNFGGAAKEAAGTTAGKLELMRIKFQELQESLGTALLPAMDMFATVLGKVADFASKHPKIFTAVAAAVATVASAIMAANVAMKLIAIQSAITGTAVEALTAKYVALAAAAAPWIAAGAALVYIGYSIYKSFTQATVGVKGFIGTGIEAIRTHRKLNLELKATQDWLNTLGSATAVYGAMGGYAQTAEKKTTGLATAINKAADAAKKLRTAMRDQLQAAVDEAKSRLDTARQNFRDFADGLSGQIMGNIDFAGIVNAGEETKKSFLDGLQLSSKSLQDFTVLLNRLTAGGASEAVVRGVAGAGVEAGTKIANELLNTLGGIETANRLTGAAQKAADQFGFNAAQRWASAGVVAATSYVDAIATVLAKYLPKLTDKSLTPKQLKKIQANLSTDLAAIQMAPPTENATLTPAAIAAPTSNVQINVNGGDPQAVVDALRRYMQTNGSVPIRVSG